MSALSSAIDGALAVQSRAISAAARTVRSDLRRHPERPPLTPPTSTQTREGLAL